MAFGSLLTGVTALRANQQSLDVIGNNLANSDTTAFKSQRTLFADLLYQTLAPASPPGDNFGGTNPVQVGFGTKVSSIDGNFTQGVLEPTGRPFDAAISGEGFFVVGTGTDRLFTRAGAFTVNSAGHLVDSTTGFFVLRTGTVGESTPTSSGFQTPGDERILIPLGATTSGTPTGNMTLRGNLSADASVGATVPISAEVFDVQGARHVLTLTFSKTAVNEWSLVGSLPATEGTLTDGSVGPIGFSGTGVPTTFNDDLTMTATFSGIADPQTIAFNLGALGGSDGMTQFSGESTARLVTQDGVPPGTLTTISVGGDGTIKGVFSNSKILPLAQLAVSSFANPRGLTREGNNLFRVSSQSGPAQIGLAQEGGRGTVEGERLEASNVDVAREFTQLIIVQRGFQVNARGITVSDAILQELADIIR